MTEKRALLLDNIESSNYRHRSNRQEESQIPESCLHEAVGISQGARG